MFISVGAVGGEWLVISACKFIHAPRNMRKA